MIESTYHLEPGHVVILSISALFLITAVSSIVYCVRHGHFRNVEEIKYSIFDEDDEYLTT